MLLTLSTTVLLILLMAVVIWKLLAIQQSSRQLRRSVEDLQKALRDEAMGDETLFVSLREAKHYAVAHQGHTQAAIAEIRAELGMPPFNWPDRAEHRKLFLEHYHREQLGPQD